MELDMNFTLSEDEEKKVASWIRDIEDTHVRELRDSGDHRTEDEIFYSGPLGGLISYTFTPTSLGVIKQVKHNKLNETLDFTDYSNW